MFIVAHRSRRSMLLYVIPAICMLTALACKSPSSDDGVEVTGVSLSASSVNLKVGGESIKLVAIVHPDDAANKDVTWASDNASIATVNASGEVLPGAEGVAAITVTTVDGRKTATCEVVVSASAPAAPAVAYASPANGRVVLSWPSVPGAVSYNVYWSTSSGVAVNNGTRIAAAASPFVHSSLTNGTAYYYIITAVGPGGESSASPQATATPQLLAPSQVGGVSASAGDGQVAIRWDPVIDADSYTIYWSTSAGVSKAVGTSVAGATSPYTHSGRTNGTNYFYIVTATNAAGESPVSSEVSAIPRAPTPGAPSGVSATAGNAQVQVGWNAAGGATSYNLYWSTSSGVTPANGTRIAGVTSPYVHSGRNNGTTYYYIVTAVNSGSESSASAQVSATPQVPTPGAPGGVSATSGDSQIRLNWSSVSGASSYNIYWSTASGVTVLNGTRISGVVSPYIHSSRNNGTSYYYIVTAVNAGGESSASAQVSATPQVPVPAAPTALSAIAGNAQAQVSWGTVDGATSYNLYWSTTSGVTPATGTRISSVSSPYTHSGLTNGTTYYYVVTAVNAGGESSASAQASARPQVPAPATPTGVAAVAGNAQVTISWSPSSGATAYHVYWSTTSGVTKTTGTSQYSASSPYAHTALANATTYYYVVAAYNAGGESAASSEVSATPHAPVEAVSLSPTVLHLALEGPSKLLVASIAPTNAENKGVKWASDNASVATVNGSGLVTPVSLGQATIVVTTDDGNKTASCAVVVSPKICTIAGNGSYGYSGDGGAATSAKLYSPGFMVVDPSGNLYIADYNNYRVRKVEPSGTITTFAGSGSGGYSGDGGDATLAQMYGPKGLAIDSHGNVYIADIDNHRVRMVSATTGVITTVAGKGLAYGVYGDDGPATSARLDMPEGLAIDKDDNLYIADSQSDRIRMVAAATGIITTVAGNGSSNFSGDGGLATSAALDSPSDLGLDASGNLYIMDSGNRRIRMVNAAGIITSIAGNGTNAYSGDGGPATTAGIGTSFAFAVDAAGNVYIADVDHYVVRFVSASSGRISTFAGRGQTGNSGDGDSALAAEIGAVYGLAVDASGRVYIADSTHNVIRRVP